MKRNVFDIMLFVAFAASQLGGIEAEAMHNESSLLLRQGILRRSAIIRSNLMSLFSWQQERRMLTIRLSGETSLSRRCFRVECIPHRQKVEDSEVSGL